MRGPERLGRSALVRVGQAAPEGWEGCQRLTIRTDAFNPEVGRELRRAWVERTPLVVELDGELPPPEPVMHAQWWELRPGLTMPAEVLRHLLTANAVDWRVPERPRFEPQERALSLGARPAEAGEPGDVVTDAGPVWCDGGPFDVFTSEVLGGRHATGGVAGEELGAGLVSAVNLAVGSLKALSPAVPRADLADDQRAAVGHLGGAANIVAPAGSGKTRVLTERARYLVRDLGVDPRAVCLVAFNVRARAEMQERTSDLPGLEVRTLNSLALAICNGTGPFARPRDHGRVEVVDERQVRDLLGEMVPRKRRAMTDQLAPWIEALGASRLGLRDPAEVERDFHPDVPDFSETAPHYVSLLDAEGLVDFDQQIMRAIDILLSDPAARAAARRTCGILLVDEFQDLTPAHLLLVRLLAGPRADVFGVGDDDQTIYGYSGASPEWLIDYHKHFPGAERHELHVNYRCPPEVVDAASNLLSHNRRRIDKQITAAPSEDRQDEGDSGSAITVETADDGAPVLRRTIESLLDGGAGPQDVAVLTRVNSTLLVPQVVLGDMGVPSNQPVGRLFLERTGVAAALAWLDIATASERDLPARALSDAARCPPRGISPRVIEWIAEQQSTSQIKALAGRIKDERSSKKVGEFADDVEMLRSRFKKAGGEVTTRSLLETVRDEMGLGGSLDTRLDASRRSVDRSAHGDDLRALISVAHLHPDPTDFRRWLFDRLADGFEGEGSGRGVHLATVHRVKGREWPHVIVYEASKGLMPHRLAGDLEEERRVFHVAITRCSESVTLICGDPPTDFQHELASRYRPPPQPDPATTSGLLTPPVVVATASSPRANTAAKPTKRPKAQPPADPVGAAAFETLKAWRLERSRADNVPAYVVFSNATLIELATHRPTTDAGLRAISGIGPAKLTAYGEAVKEILGQFATP
ncbi:UvrD-helicase domain-containing protein [Candidatus Poriferisocius sp.]|uniref:UvrD-helicase domain-containing protein n=1 Tax=Candidatus Poriferisocius sp. TaxID=3101276 RepID=UPI003B5AB5E1